MKVKLISHTTSDIDKFKDLEDLIAFVARVSNPENQHNTETSSKLIQYLTKHKHWSPFEMADITLEIETTREIAHQIIRHRSFSFQEFCLSGDTEIYFDLPVGIREGKKRLYKKTIKELFDTMNSNEHNFNRIKNMYIRTYDTNNREFSNTHISNIFYTGPKEVYKITLADKKTITCTSEHKFLTEEYKFLPIKDIIGLSKTKNTATMSKKAKIAVNGKPAYQDKEWLSKAKQLCIEEGTGVTGIAEKAGCSYHTIRKWLRIHGLQFSKKEVASYTPIWNKGKFGYKLPPKSEETREKHRQSAKKGADSNLWRGGVDRPERQKIQDHIGKYRNKLLTEANFKCSRCGSSDKLELHHIIPVYEDITKAYDINNIEVICGKCHKKHHNNYKEHKIWRQRSKGNTMSTKFCEVVSVEYLGIEDTYDLEVISNNHNYIANGIVVHNSQRYAKALDYEYSEARLQDLKNRQNSIETTDEELQEWWEKTQYDVITLANSAYNEALDRGIAKEVARKVLPEGLTKTRIYMKGSIRSWIHYIEVRTDPTTQKEHREVALACADEITKVFKNIKYFVKG